jgi:hypothetical protein
LKIRNLILLYTARSYGTDFHDVTCMTRSERGKHQNFLLVSVAQVFHSFSMGVQGPCENYRNGIRKFWSLVVSMCLRDTWGEAKREISAEISDFNSTEILTSRKQRRRDTPHHRMCLNTSCDVVEIHKEVKQVISQYRGPHIRQRQTSNRTWI